MRHTSSPRASRLGEIFSVVAAFFFPIFYAFLFVVGFSLADRLFRGPRLPDGEIRALELDDGGGEVHVGKRGDVYSTWLLVETGEGRVLIPRDRVKSLQLARD